MAPMILCMGSLELTAAVCYVRCGRAAVQGKHDAKLTAINLLPD